MNNIKLTKHDNAKAQQMIAELKASAISSLPVVGAGEPAPAISTDEDFIDYGTPLSGEKAERIKRVRESVIQFMHGVKK